MSRRKKKHFLKNFVFTIFILLIVAFGVLYVCKKTNFLSNFEIGKKIVKEKEKKTLQIINEKSNTRPIAVMINNNHDAWPHAGLQDSYINYEMVVEGGITRIMAIYKDKDTAKIGSVRSSRHYFLDYALENDAIYVHFGFSERAKDDIKSLGINNVNGLYDDAFWRDKTLNKAYEHTAFTSMEKINAFVERKGYRTTTEESPLLKYNVDGVDLSKKEGAKKADEVKIEYSSYQTTSYEYDKEKKVYLRSMSNKQHVDAITGEQYTAKNIIVYQIYNYSIDSYGRQDLKNIGNGKGYYITDGYAIPITWEKSSRASKTIYRYEDGNEISVNDGNTWIQIQPEGKKLDIIEHTAEVTE